LHSRSKPSAASQRPGASHSQTETSLESFFQQLALVGPPLLLAMVAHEYAHGYAAMKQGDMTAYQLGRLTFNPLKHIDPFMTIILPVVLMLLNAPIFGGAKPVPVNPRNYRNYKRGDIIVSLAGVATNVAIAILSVPVIVLLGWIGSQAPGLVRPLGVLQHMLTVGVFINLLLAAFNLLPIPPLDGSHVFKYMLPPKWSLAYQNAGRYGLLILFAFLSFARPVLMYWLMPAYVLDSLARTLYLPFMLPSPFST
jgi:Zn-dependent protease